MRVNFYATLRAAVGEKTVDVPLRDGASVIELAHEIARRWPTLSERVLDEKGCISHQVHFLVGGRNVRWLPDGAETTLLAADVVDVFPPTAGG